MEKSIEKELVAKVPQEITKSNLRAEEKKAEKTSGETIELLNKNGVFERAEDIPFSLDQEFNAAIDEGLDQLDEWEDENSKKLRIWIDPDEEGDESREMEITAGELRQIVRTMRDKKNSVSHGKPFRFNVVWALHTIEQEREMDERYRAERKAGLLKNIEKFQGNEFLWYAFQRDPYDPLSLDEIKKMNAEEMRRAVEAEKGEFADWWGLQVISNSPSFNAEAYAEELAEAEEIRKKALGFLENLSEEEVIEVQFPGDKEAHEVAVCSVRWHIKTMDKEGLKELSYLLENRKISGKKKFLPFYRRLA